MNHVANLLQNQSIQTQIKEAVHPIGSMIYNELYLYIWFICIYNVFLLLVILANFFLLLHLLQNTYKPRVA